jgi:pyridoxal phosphate enzyme (YggS family)
VIRERVSAVSERIAQAAERAGRDPAEITLVAVSKTQPPEAVREAYEAGVRVFGENRVQEAEEKKAALSSLPDAQWHLVGHLQANKARKALDLFDLIHSLDGVELGQRLDRLATEGRQPYPVLVEVEMGGEATKHGIDPSAVLGVLGRLKELPHLSIQGLMCIPPPDPDTEKARGFFRRLRALRDEAVSLGVLGGAQLSMGMSDDFEVAIEEGATLVRVGTAIFGERRALPPRQ